MDPRVPPPFALEQLPGSAGVLLLRLAGELDLATTPEVAEALGEGLRGGARTVVLDLAEVTFMDSSMLRELLRVRGELEPGGGAVVLVAPREPVLRLLELTGTRELFGVAPTRDEALAGVRAD